MFNDAAVDNDFKIVRKTLQEELIQFGNGLPSFLVYCLKLISSLTQFDDLSCKIK